MVNWVNAAIQRRIEFKSGIQVENSTRAKRSECCGIRN